MVTLTEAVRAEQRLAGRLPLVEHLARAARVLARTRTGALGADDILVGGGATVVLGARQGPAPAGEKIEPATLKPPADDEAHRHRPARGPDQQCPPLDPGSRLRGGPTGSSPEASRSGSSQSVRGGDRSGGEEMATQTESPEREAVRSLGALVHFVLAGSFPGPEPLADLAEGAPAALIAVAERALGRQTGAYLGPAEVADDLERHMPRAVVAGDPAAARRKRIALIAAAAVAVIALAGLGLGWRRERLLRDKAVTTADQARAARRTDAFVVAQAYADKAAALAADDVRLSAAVYAAAVIDRIPASDSRPPARALRAAAQSHLLAARLGLVQGIESDRDAGGPVTALAASPRSVATAAGRGIKLWREKGEPAGALTGHGAEVVALAMSESGTVLVSADRGGTILVWDTASRHPDRELRKGGDPVADVAVAPVASGMVAAAERGGAVTLFTLDSGKGASARSLAAHRADATAVAFSPDADLLATGARDGSLALWNPATGAQVGKLGGHNAAVLDLAFAPDGGRLASAASDGSIRLWSPTERSLVAGLAGHRAPVTSLGFSPDGAMLFAAAADGSVRAWFAADGQAALALDGHARGASFAAVTAAGLVMTAGADGHLRTWRLGGARALIAPAELTGAITFSPDGQVVAAAAVDQRVHRFRLESGQPLPALVGHTSAIDAVAFSPDGALMATGGDDGTARIWRAGDGQPLASLVGHRGAVEAVAFAPSGLIVATAGDDHTVRLWSPSGGQTLGVLDEHEDRVVDLAFSPDGKRLAAVGWDGRLQLWTMQKKGAVPERSVPGEGRWFSVDFSPDGAHVLAAGERGLVVFRAADGSVAATLEGAGESPVEAHFSPDGTLVVSARADGVARVHSFPAGQPLLAIPADPPLVAAATGRDGTIMAWGDGPRIRLAPLDMSLVRRPAAELRRDAETAAGLELRGFALTHR